MGTLGWLERCSSLPVSTVNKSRALLACTVVDTALCQYNPVPQALVNSEKTPKTEGLTLKRSDEAGVTLSRVQPASGHLHNQVAINPSLFLFFGLQFGNITTNKLG